MAQTMNPEQSRHERFIAYTALLKERFDAGCLAELQPLPQWVVWRGELEDGKNKKVPYNPNVRNARASVKIPKSWGTLDQVPYCSGKRPLFRSRLYDNPATCDD